MTDLSPSFPWFALNIRMYKYEYVERALESKGHHVFSPYYVSKYTTSGGRQREVRKPLFPGYLFCAFHPWQRLSILTVPGVTKILGLEGTISPISPDEIEAIRRTVDSGLYYEPFELLEPGEMVQVQSGPLTGVKGMVVYHKASYRIVITVSALGGRAVLVEVDRNCVVPVKKAAVMEPVRSAVA
jgi:transcriptional antiterminator NusG